MFATVKAKSTFEMTCKRTSSLQVPQPHRQHAWNVCRTWGVQLRCSHQKFKRCEGELDKSCYSVLLDPPYVSYIKLYRLWAVVLQPQKIVKAQVRLRKQATERTDPDSMGFIKTISEWSQEFLETRRSTRSRTCTTAIFLATQDRSPREIKTTQLLRWMRRTPFATCTGLLQTNAYSRLRLSKLSSQGVSKTSTC